MSAFIAVAATLILLVIGLIVRPLLKRQDARVAVDPAQLNASLIKDELAALERERSSGSVTGSEYAQARDDLARRLLEDTGSPAATSAGAPAATGRSWRTLIAIALLVPLAAGLLYARLGTPGALEAPPPAASMANHPGIDTMVNSLAAKLAANPDNPEGWAMLGRSYTVLGRYAEAVAAYEKIGPGLEQNATWLAEYGKAFAMKLGGNPVGRPEQLAQQALKLDPNNLLALMLASYAAAARSDFAAVSPLAERALSRVPAGSEDQRFLQDLLDKSRAQLGGAPASATTSTTTAAAAPASRSLSLDVAIQPALNAEALKATLDRKP